MTLSWEPRLFIFVNRRLLGPVLLSPTESGPAGFRPRRLGPGDLQRFPGPPLFNSSSDGCGGSNLSNCFAGRLTSHSGIAECGWPIALRRDIAVASAGASLMSTLLNRELRHAPRRLITSLRFALCPRQDFQPCPVQERLLPGSSANAERELLPHGTADARAPGALFGNSDRSRVSGSRHPVSCRPR